MKIQLPENINSDYTGYLHLMQLHENLSNSHSHDVELNFSHVKWIEANLMAVIGAILSIHKKSKKITIEGLKPNHTDLFSRNQFLSTEFNHERRVDSNQTIIPYKKFSPLADQDFIRYIKEELLNKPDFPKHTQKLGDKIAESIFELYENARTHGRCEHIYTCGQYYPNKTPKILDITIVDMGKTIKTNVNEYLKQGLSGVEAIEWALKNGNTTKVDNIPGGLGLNIMFEFIQLNQGKVQIVSADGFWEYKKPQTETRICDHSFPGTIVNIEFNLDDPAYYSLKQERDIPLDDIF